MSSQPHIPYQEMSFFVHEGSYLKAPEGNILLSIMDGFQVATWRSIFRHRLRPYQREYSLAYQQLKPQSHCTNFKEWINRAFVRNRHLPGFNKTYTLVENMQKICCLKQ